MKKERLRDFNGIEQDRLITDYQKILSIIRNYDSHMVYSLAYSLIDLARMRALIEFNDIKTTTFNEPSQ